MQQRDDRSLGELFAELSRETSHLVRQEVQLAKTEMSQKASEAGKDIGYLAVGGAVAYAGFLAIVAALVGLLALWLPVWASALVVGIVVAGIGYYFVNSGMKKLKQMSFAPERTIETLKEDKEWAKDQTK